MPLAPTIGWDKTSNVIPLVFPPSSSYLPNHLVDSYSISVRREAQIPFTVLDTVAASLGRYVFSGKLNGSYEFRLRAINARGMSDWGPSVVTEPLPVGKDKAQCCCSTSCSGVFFRSDGGGGQTGRRQLCLTDLILLTNLLPLKKYTS